jgi:Integral membrane protein S linking to the trans Golgi network
MPVSWWLATIIEAAVAILLGEYVCLKFEQKEIQIFNRIMDIVSHEKVQLKKKKKDRQPRDNFELKEVITL